MFVQTPNFYEYPLFLFHGAVTHCKHIVSGLFHGPHRTTFHLSLAVLVHYRFQRVFSLAG